jgi:hypothetical protein
VLSFNGTPRSITLASPSSSEAFRTLAEDQSNPTVPVSIDRLLDQSPTPHAIFQDVYNILGPDASAYLRPICEALYAIQPEGVAAVKSVYSNGSRFPDMEPDMEPFGTTLLRLMPKRLGSLRMGLWRHGGLCALQSLSYFIGRLLIVVCRRQCTTITNASGSS